MIYDSHIADLLGHDGHYIYVDVGGGSTEIVVYARGSKVEARSFRLGTVRIFSGAEAPAEWLHFEEWLREVARTWHPSGIIGSGGNINKLFRIALSPAKTDLARRPFSPQGVRESSSPFPRNNRLSPSFSKNCNITSPFRREAALNFIEERR